MSKAKQMKTHYWADEFDLNQNDINAIAEDIKKNGYNPSHPILTLKDGTIIDGRNRWKACEIAGVDPVIEVVNPNGEELTDMEIFKIVVRENCLRRDDTNSARSIGAARAWKRLYPDGAPGRGGDPKRGQKCKTAPLSYEAFALDNFKVKERCAKQALAIVNFGLERLVKEARKSLDSAYTEYQKLKADDMERQMKIDALMERDDCADLRERMDNGTISIDEAIAIMMDRTKQERERREARERAQRQVRETVESFTRFKVDDGTLEAFSAADTKQLKKINDEIPSFIDGVSKIHAAIKEALKTNK